MRGDPKRLQAFENEVGRTNRPWTIVASAAGQSVVLAGAILFALMRTDALPRGLTRIGLPLPAATRAAQPASATPPRLGVRPARPALLMFPTANARRVSEVLSQGDAPYIGPGTETGLPASDGIRGLGICIGCTPADPPATAPKPAAPKPVNSETDAAAPRPISVSSTIQAARLTHQVKPVYPILAINGRISGTVRLAAIISRDGTLQNPRPLSGHALLTRSAIDAVRQWRYQPTYLNGQPVEVVTLIEVNFKLAR